MATVTNQWNNEEPKYKITLNVDRNLLQIGWNRNCGQLNSNTVYIEDIMLVKSSAEFRLDQALKMLW